MWSRACLGALACILGGCGPADLRLLPPTGLPTTGALFTVVQGPQEPAFVIGEHADAPRLLSVDLDPDGPVTLTVMHTAESLDDLGLSPGRIQSVAEDRCGARALPTQSNLHAITIVNGAASDWTVPSGLPPILQTLRIDGPCPCSGFALDQSVRSNRNIIAYFGDDGQGELLMHPSGFERLSLDGQLTTVATSTSIPDDPLRTVARDSSGGIWLGARRTLWRGLPEGDFVVVRTFDDNDGLLHMDGGEGPDGFELFATTESGRLIQLLPGPEKELLPAATSIVDPMQPGRIAWIGPGHVVTMQVGTADLVWVQDGVEYRRVAVTVESGGLLRMSAIPGFGVVVITRLNKILYFSDSGTGELKGAPDMAETRALSPFPGGFIYAGDSGYLQQYHVDLGFCPRQPLDGLQRIVGVTSFGDRWLAISPDTPSGTLLRIFEATPLIPDSD